MILMRRVSLLVTLTVVMLVGCSDDSSGPEELPECTGQVTVSISAGTEPTFNWAPACRGFLLLVEEGATDVWSVITLGSNDLAPPVTYGVVPAGATELDTPVPLMVGTTYDVILFRHTGPGDDDGEIVTIQEFTP